MGVNTFIGEGKNMYKLIEELYPICRSITGDGLRKTLAILQQYVPLTIQEVPTGTEVFDWTIPKEWNIRDAWVKDKHGEKIIDFRNHNLHVLNYSAPVHQKVSLDELKEHLYTLPEQPDLIPYRTSYYQEKWAFCTTHRQKIALADEEYEVFIDSALEDGHLTYGELFIPGSSQEEVLISCHICHPSLCNDNLSGIATAIFLAQHLQEQNSYYGYRFVFVPVTIGAIAWLARNEAKVSRIKYGLVISNLGDAGGFTYKKTRKTPSAINDVVLHALKRSGIPYTISDFVPYGYDERQYASPGFNLAVGSLMRSPNGGYPEYHTSADNLSFVRPGYLEESLLLLQEITFMLDHNHVYLNQHMKGEPQLGRRGLYDRMSGDADVQRKQMAVLWILNYSDGQHSLLDIAEKAGMPFSLVKDTADILLKIDLLKLVE